MAFLFGYVFAVNLLIFYFYKKNKILCNLKLHAFYVSSYLDYNCIRPSNYACKISISVFDSFSI